MDGRTITFAYFGKEVASSRLRGLIPQQELRKRGIRSGKDVLVYGKHFLGFDDIGQYGVKVFDICDDHFHTPDLERYYRTHADKADFLTCNSEYMKQRIRMETGRDAVVIPEPYESKEGEPGIAPYLYWFGHKSNLDDIERLKPNLRHPLLILTNSFGYMEWTKEKHDEVMKLPLIVVIPVGKSLAKSENRIVESIRQGKYVCAEFLPAYDPFSAFFPLVDIPTHIEAALSDPEASIAKIKAAQDYIRDRYSPQTIADKWLEVIYGIEHLH